MLTVALQSDRGIDRLGATQAAAMFAAALLAPLVLWLAGKHVVHLPVQRHRSEALSAEVSHKSGLRIPVALDDYPRD